MSLFLQQLNYLAFTSGKSLNLTKTKNLFLSLFLFYPFQTNLLTSHRRSLLMVSPPCFLSACLRWPLVFFFGGGGVFLRTMTLNSRSLPLKWAVVCALCQIWLLRFSFLHCWYGRHVARSAQDFDVRRIFWWLDLICSARLVGLMFNTC